MCTEYKIYVVRNDNNDTSWQKVCLSSHLHVPVGSHSRRTWDSHNIQVCDFFFPATGLQKPRQILKISKKGISASLIHIHGLEPASYTFCWESRSGSQFQAHPSSPTQGLIETWESASPILATRAEERNPLFKFPVRFFSHWWHQKWKADKVWYAVWFPSSSQIRKTCICSSALPQLTSPELVSEIWRPGLLVGCLMQAGLSPPPGWSEMSLSILTLLLLSWAELGQLQGLRPAGDTSFYMAVTSASSIFLISFIQVKRKPSFTLCSWHSLCCCCC